MQASRRLSIMIVVVPALAVGGMAVAGCDGRDGQAPVDQALVIEVFDKDDPATLILVVTDEDIEAFDLIVSSARPPHGLIKLRDQDCLTRAREIVLGSPPLRYFGVRVTVEGTQVWGSVVPVGSPGPGFGALLTLGAMVGGDWPGEFAEDSLSLRSNGTFVDGVGLVEAAHTAWLRTQDDGQS